MNMTRSSLAFFSLEPITRKAFWRARQLPIRLIILTIAIGLPLATFAQLSDDFTTDSVLNSSLWTTASSVLSGLAANFNSSLITPTLAFNGAGMKVSGVNASNELAGVQSRATFQPPFTLTVTVTSAQAHGNAFELFLVRADQAQWMNVAGNLNPGNGSYFGVWVNYGNSGLPYLSLGNNLYSDPKTNSPYTLQLFVERTGLAAVSLSSSNGASLAVQSHLNIGTGPFYVILGQREGGPIAPGANLATWKNVSVVPLAPAPVLAPITVANGKVTLVWSAVAGATYQLQYTTALSPAQWNNFGAAVTAGATRVTELDSTSIDAQRFYRVIVMQ
jgi:hypothetical protein